jgi:hypothetical protein
MVYKTQDYWVSGLELSGILKNTKEHSILENGSVFILRGLPPPHQGMDTGPISKTFRSFVFFRIPDDGQRQKPRNPENIKALCTFGGTFQFICKTN